MNNTYKTAEIASLIGIHPNTVRLYEKLKLIPKPARQPNGYRVFSDLHVEQFKLARIAFQIEVLQNGLRKKVVDIVKTSAARDFDQALKLTDEYLHQIKEELHNAEEAIRIAKHLVSSQSPEQALILKRKQAADHLHISMDTLRNWERNNLLTVSRKENGYRLYSAQDIRRLRIIRSLRCAGYSLSSILRMLTELACNPNANIRKILNTPRNGDDIISACDKLILSLHAAEENAKSMKQILQQMRCKFS